LGPNLIFDPDRILDRLRGMLSGLSDVSLATAKTVEGQILQTYRTQVPNPDVAVLLPPTSVFATADLDIDLTAMSGQTPVTVGFALGELRLVEIDFHGFFEEVGRRNGTPELGLISLVDRYTLTLGRDTSIVVPAPETVLAFSDNEDLRVLDPVYPTGQCFSAEELELVQPSSIACSQSHVAEVFFVSRFDEAIGVPYPGVEPLIAEATTACNTAFGEITETPGEATVLFIRIFRPTAETWLLGDRELVCFVQYPEPVQVLMTQFDPLRAFGLASTFALRAGDCIADDSLGSAALLTVDCDTTHVWEVYLSQRLPDGPYPGDDAVSSLANETCVDAFEPAVASVYGESQWFVEHLHPDMEGWDTIGDRLVTCLLTIYEGVTRSALRSGT
jgi:hypothetical protein